MSFLSIDCSTEKGSLFVKAKNKTFSKVLQSDKSNNDLLMKQILDFFTEKELKFSDLSKIYVNEGPGNFSSLRSSLAIAKGISISKNLNLFGYNTFLWSCAKFFSNKDFILSFVKFREKYFMKKFDKNLVSNVQAKEIKEEDILKKYENSFKVIPKRLAQNFSKKILTLNNLIIVDLNHEDLEILQLKGLLNKSLIKPLYLN